MDAGWAASALSMIWFFYHEGMTLDWWKAYGEPLLPSLIMGAWMEIGRFAGSFFAAFVCLGVASLLALTLLIEARSVKARTPSLFRPKS
ncbi:hypothetical protein [Paenibacillus xerothermodurans]|uniref:hypothetical protein n=1 Tax=Paenibacillus xerothermodurans TaxID=1977292 RepID=UPI001FB56400|nr:hypothetical protein [Paenibacillus xerothermodurans]